MKKVPKIGDVFEIPLADKRKVFGQYIYLDNRNGPLICIFNHMNTFNDQQVRIWNKMIDLIDEFTNNKLEFSELAASLEGVFGAGEFKDAALIKQWYEHWSPLEIYNAVKLDRGEPAIKKEIVQDIEKMKDFLRKQLERQTKVDEA